MAGQVDSLRAPSHLVNNWPWEKTRLFWGRQITTQATLKQWVGRGSPVKKFRALRFTSLLTWPVWMNTSRERPPRAHLLAQVLTAVSQDVKLRSGPMATLGSKTMKKDHQMRRTQRNTEASSPKETWVGEIRKTPVPVSHPLDWSKARQNSWLQLAVTRWTSATLNSK
jgi:hypothetical protein